MEPVLESPARTGHFTVGRPSSSPLSRFAHTSGDGGDLGNHATAHRDGKSRSAGTWPALTSILDI